MDVAFEGEFIQATKVKGGKFGSILRLEALNAFSLVKTVRSTSFTLPVTTTKLTPRPQVFFEEGEFAGQQAIIIKPAKAFPFMRLPAEVRVRIYTYYLAPGGICNKSVVLESRRSNRDVWAKSYSESSKNRVGLLTVNKTIHEEANPILYAHGLKFESTNTLVDFILGAPDSMKPLLREIEIKSFVKTQARNCLNALAACENLTKFHIDAGVSSDSDVGKAARSFWGEASKFLEAMSAKRGEKGSGVEVLSFGRQAFTTKNDKNALTPWSDSMRDAFVEALRAKMK